MFFILGTKGVLDIRRQSEFFDCNNFFDADLISERGLLAAIIYRAAIDLEGNDKKEHESATKFFKDEKICSEGYLSFEYCCEILEVDANRIRKLLSSHGLFTFKPKSKEERRYRSGRGRRGIRGI